MHFTMIFVDGLGLGSEYNNPVALARTPNIDRLLGGHYFWQEKNIRNENCTFLALDATLGVPGVPQSATGQTALWTGINTAELLGYHLNAYPNEELKEVINKYSIFKQLAEQGKKVCYANAFTQKYEELIAVGQKKHSASTLCALAGGVRLRRREDLLQGKAVYQDITNEIFRRKGEDVPLAKPSHAGKNLAGISLEHDFTLFEYFQTDLQGHKQDKEKAILTIEILDEFLGGYFTVAGNLDPAVSQMALLLTSDHGNIEDLTTASHTLNKVPALCWSNFALKWPEMKSICEVTPAILKIILGNS
ncbi:MAG TPA: metalloenzyme [Peptococcaceae bacterium]|nr:metalloenzyme [Peptococcaceae bacterium]